MLWVCGSILMKQSADIPVITVDGPGGTGKGTVCSNLATVLGWHLLDSGSLYRVLALAALEAGMKLEDAPRLHELAVTLDVSFRRDQTGPGMRVYLGADDVSSKIRTEECGNAASKIATYQQVRRALLQRQRGFKQAPGLIADGRDMGTVVFPEAKLKLFLTATLQERVNRRYKQLKEQGFSVNLPRLSAEIAERDERDQARTASPLMPAPGAVVIDTTDISVEEVDRQVLELVKDTFPDIAYQLPIN